MISKRELWVGVSAFAGAALAPGLAHAAPAIVRMPITLAPNGMPLLLLTINGKGPYKFLIDTGAFSALIKESLAIELGLTRAGTIRTTSLKGYEDSYIYQAQNIVLGGGFRLPKMALVGLAKFAFTGVDGILPASILTFVPSQLDYEASEIRYYLNGAEMDLDGFEKVPAYYQDEGRGDAQKVYVYVTIGTDKVVCCLDTGAGSGLLLSGATVGRLKLWDRFPILSNSSGVGTNGERLKTRQVMGTDISIGEVHVARMPLTLSDPDDRDDLNNTGMDGLLGTPFLRRFTVAFGAHKALYLKPNSAFATIGSLIPTMVLPDPVPAPPDKPVLPFSYGDDRKITLPGMCADKPPFPCVLATGVMHSSINVKWAAELDLTTLPSGDFSASSVGIAGVTLPKLAFKPNTAPDCGLRLGLDFLMAMPSTLDFDLNQMTFFIGSKPDITGYSQVAGRRALAPGGEARLYLTLRLEGVDTLCLVDTDTQAALILLGKTVTSRRLWDKFADAQDRLLIYDDGRIVKTRYVHMGQADIGPFQIAASPVTLIDPASSPEPMFEGVDAVIGMGFLHRFNMVLMADGVYFKPNGNFKTQ